MIEALSKWSEEKKIEWHHFGDGEDKEYIISLAEKALTDNKNILYYLHGFTANSDVMKFYSENRIDCFINVSETEGCPVSIQEAMSYGIPIIGTNVGGVSELINGNGILLKADTTIEEISTALKSMVNLSCKKMTEMRKKSYEIWEEQYQADVNVMRLVKVFEELV